jgi:hypothetical protein
MMRLRADNPGKAFKLTRSLEKALGLEQLQINSCQISVAIEIY